MTIKTTLLSVYDKTGIVDFARGLRELGVGLISTGGTGRLLTEKGIAVRDIADYTGFPEILDGRVKSLHPKIHAGLLFRRGKASDRETISKLGITPIDMVVVNLYPFEKVTAESRNLETALENIDIGGPTMIRAAAKNYQDVAVVIDPADYSQVLAELGDNDGKLSEKTSAQLMLKAFERTAAYDATISSFFQTRAPSGMHSEWPAPRNLVLNFEKIQDLRYGENPHQKAAVYRTPYAKNCIASSPMVAGEKALSYTNILDADAAYSMVDELGGITATAIIKHMNPCGVGIGKTLAESCRKALETDPISSFGGIYAFTKPVDIETSNLLSDKFVELVLAPGFEAEALRVLSAKKNRRILDISGPLNTKSEKAGTQKAFRWIHGGMLYQDTDEKLIDQQNLKTVTKRQPSVSELNTIQFAWKIVKHVKSNAIVLCSEEQLVGVGAGQMSRVDSCRIALMKAQDAGLSVKGTVMASDAFLPFRDSVDLMGKAGVTAIIQPGGSIRDAEVIQAADEFGIAMQFTSIRHFVH